MKETSGQNVSGMTFVLKQLEDNILVDSDMIASWEYNLYLYITRVQKQSTVTKYNTLVSLSNVLYLQTERTSKNPDL